MPLESSRIYSVRTLYTYEVHILVNHSHVDLHPSLSPDRCNDQYITEPQKYLPIRWEPANGYLFQKLFQDPSS